MKLLTAAVGSRFNLCWRTAQNITTALPDGSNRSTLHDTILVLGVWYQ